jgi:hypothetical protein
MPRKTTTMTLSFWVPPETTVPEGEAVAWFAGHRDALQPYNEHEGGVLIDAGSTSAGFADTLFWLVPSLCLNAVAGVLDSGRAEVSLFAYDTDITLFRNGDGDGDSDTVTLTSNIAEPARFATWPLLDALVGAGERYARLVEQLWLADSEARRTLPDLQALAVKTRAALDAATPRS